MSVLSGIFLHALGGGAAASFYLPFKKVRDWAWESYWLISGVAAWILTPLVVGYLTIPNLMTVLLQSPGKALGWAFVFGVLWGVGGLTFGLTMRYLGLSLGYAVALGFSAAFGTLIPPLFEGQFGELLADAGGRWILLGIAVCLAGIATCGRAGMIKEKELGSEGARKTIREYDLRRGLCVALVCGLLSACMAFGLAAGRPIAETAVAHGTRSLWQNNAVLVVVLWGGFLTNFVWCLILNWRNRSFKNYRSAPSTSLGRNYFFSSLAGVIWFLQFFFYGMGSTRMGQYDFVSWTLHMSFIIVMSNLWALYLKEWAGSSRRALRTVKLGIALILLSIVVIGYGSSIF
ncbi:MAG: L-rhamnose/proton symporter RhaT [Opitutales bacterium]|nr:L-rhamnose/proton symporter RhaT [Opitutales bacterium]